MRRERYDALTRDQLIDLVEKEKDRARKQSTIAESWRAKYHDCAERCRKLEQLPLPFPLT